MALTNDAVHLLSNATAMLSEDYELQPVVQEARFGQTAQHITNTKKWTSGAKHFKFIDQEFSRASVTTDLEAGSPKAGRVNLLDVKIEEANLRQLQFALDYSLAAIMEVNGDDAAWNLKTELRLAGDEALGEKRNQMIHQGLSLTKAECAAVYDDDGTAYTDSSSTKTAFIQIQNGSPSNFKMGEVLKITTSGSNVYVAVMDVCHDAYYRGLAVGPGISVAFADGSTAADSLGLAFSAWADEGTVDADLDTLENDVNNATVVNQPIYGFDDASNAGYPCAFDELFKSLATDWTAALPYFSVTDRRAMGKNFLVPYGRNYNTGSNVDLDLDTHFAPMADTMGMVFGPSRAYRRNKDYKMTDGIVVIAPPSLVNAAARQAGTSSALYTKAIASNMDAARRKQIAVYGWEGVVLHHPTLPPLLLQADPQAKANTIRTIEPASFCWVRMSDNGMKPQFVPGAIGGIWHPLQDGGKITKKFRANGFVYETLFCEQPRVNYDIQGVKSDIT